MKERSDARAQAALVAVTLSLALVLMPAEVEAAISANAPTSATVSGTATYRERVALTHDAVFEAVLEEVSRADAPAEILASVHRNQPGQVPIAFELSYEPGRIRSSGTYVVRATVSEAGRLRFTGEQPAPMGASPGPGRIAILMHPVTNAGGVESGAGIGRALAPFPATFVGLLPCADCAGIRYRIDFFEGGSYEQRMTYLRSGHDESFYQFGRWTLSGDGRTLTLGGGADRALWSLQDHNMLHKLDLHGRRIDSKLPDELTRRRSANPMEPRGTVSGMFRSMADASRFRECRSGLEWPVAMSDDYRALERAYLTQRDAPGTELMVSLEGRIEQRPKIEGRGSEATLVVERFLRASPGATCGASMASADVEDSRWRLVDLGGHPVTVPKDEHELWMTLDSHQKRLTGSGGCNRISGGYEIGAATLRFTRVASTMMACPSLDLETQFLRALDATRTYRVSGRALELRDKTGTVIARLEEANLN